MRSSDQLREDLALALTAVKAAEGPILRYFRSEDIGLVHKGDGSPVTLADKAAEAAIREVLEAGSPDCDILGEEEAGADDAQIDALVAERDTARSEKDWERADALRDELTQRGIELLDSPQGTRWRRR